MSTAFSMKPIERKCENPDCRYPQFTTMRVDGEKYCSPRCRRDHSMKLQAEADLALLKAADRKAALSELWRTFGKLQDKFDDVAAQQSKPLSVRVYIPTVTPGTKPLIVCKCCGETFTPRLGKSSGFCRKRECRSAHSRLNNNRRRGVSGELHKMICIHCGEEFQPRNANHKISVCRRENCQSIHAKARHASRLNQMTSDERFAHEQKCRERNRRNNQKLADLYEAAKRFGLGKATKKGGGPRQYGQQQRDLVFKMKYIVNLGKQESTDETRNK